MEANQMPPLGHSKADALWVDKLAEWIDGIGAEEQTPGDVLVSPDPTTTFVWVRTSAEWTGSCRVRIYDVAGRQLRETLLGERGGEVDLSPFPTGILILSPEDDNGQRQERKVMKR